jgi:predicted GIY-YIG superfamily endonuclease
MVNAMIYTLKCAQGKYYVGKTQAERVCERFREHLRARGSAWTRKYTPERIMHVVPCGDPLQEDFEVEKCMRDHGIDNVRGGRYSKVELSEDTEFELVKKLSHAKEACFRCDEVGHRATACGVGSQTIPDFMKPKKHIIAKYKRCHAAREIVRMLREAQRGRVSYEEFRRMYDKLYDKFLGH